MRKTVFLPTIIFCFFFGIALISGQTAREEARRHFDRGMAAVEMAKFPEDYAAAIGEFDQAAKLAPNWPDIYYNLGLVHEKAGNLSDAIMNFLQYLQLAPHANDAEAVKSLINKLEYRFEQSSNGETLLHEAVIKGKKEMVEMLIAGGADINVKNNYDRTLLHEASVYNRKEMAELLIAKGADINAKDKDGVTPLSNAIFSDSKEVVELLIAKGADVNTRDQRGLTPLYGASVSNRKEMAELLIAKGADVNVRDENQLTPLYETSIYGNKEVAELLIAKGADINIKNNLGKTPLHEAIINCHKEMVELLIAKGAAIDAKDNFGNTPLDEAKHSYKLNKRAAQKEMIDLLKKYGAK